VKELRELGVAVEEVATGATAPAAPRLALLDNPEVKVWGHDVTAERGATYQYRLRVLTNNPLFGRSLQPAQAALAAQNTLAGPWSAWSAPVTVLPAEYYFVTSAESRNDITPRPRATAELFVYYYGFYRKASVSLEPGDKLMATAKLPELKFADMDLLKLDPDAAELARPTAAAPEAPASPNREGGGRRGGLAPGGGGPDGPALRRDRDEALAAQPSSGDPLLTIGAPKERQMVVDATFLDVAQAPAPPSEIAGDVRNRYFAVLRDGAGRLVTRVADAERTQGMYRQFDASAKAGLTQGVPVLKAAAPGQTLPTRRDRPKAPDAPSGGGGGG